MDRRQLLKGAMFGTAALALHGTGAAAAVPSSAVTGYDDRLREIERRHGGRLGVAILDTGNERRASCRGDERFLICSTFKLLLVAAVLARVEQGREHLDRRIVFDKSVLLDWAPVTGMNVGPPGMRVDELCQAAIMLSDNTAANLLLDAVGGPSTVTAYARSLGDTRTRLDRREPELNRPDGDLDTTTPWAMLGDLRKLLLGDALSAPSRQRLDDWLALNQTGAYALRAWLPGDWRVGDKTGSGQDASNDVAIIRPPGRAPLLVAAFYSNPGIDADGRRSVLAEVGRTVASF